MVVGLVFIAIQICCTDMPKQENLGPLVISVDLGSLVCKRYLFYFISEINPIFFWWAWCCSRLRVIAELRHGDLFHSSNIVSR